MNKCKKLLITGPPCVGKGTMSSLLSIHYNLPLIFEQKALKFQNQRQNPNRDIQHWNFFKEAVASLDPSEGYIIEGFPRNIEQALLMEINHLQYDLVIELYQPEELIVAKANFRKICESCDIVYNTQEFHLGQYVLKKLENEKEGVCDKCGGMLMKRKEDEKKNVRRRFFDYLVNCDSLRPYFEKKGKLLVFELFRGVEDIKRLIKEIDLFYEKGKVEKVNKN